MATPKKWFEVQLEVAAAQREAVINRLFEIGAEGVNESEETVRAYFPESEKAAVKRELDAYAASLAEMFPKSPKVQAKFHAVEQENWAERYKEFYQAQRLTHVFYLKPAWDTKAEVPDGMIPLVMEPGQAFGTGLHASTTLCLRLIEHTADQLAKLAPTRLVDVGTGTGILAIAAAKLGIGHVSAVDIDPIAVVTANENFALNGCKGLKATTQGLHELKGPFDIIVSNILLEAHLELAPEYDRCLAPGGHLILSGLLTPQHQETDDAMRAQGLVPDGTESQQEWLALLYRKPS
jgi:ribosomal protein L11 methyltransferase